MSRAYRISVKESITKHIQGSDEICTRLELLEILPPETMAELLRHELEHKGYRPTNDGKLQRVENNTTITIDPLNGEVSLRAEIEKTITEQGTRDGSGWDDMGPSRDAVESRTRELLKEDLESRISQKQSKLQEKASQKLEQALTHVQPQLSEIVNRVTREALKQKAAQMGTIQEITEDPSTGSMTIKVEV